MIRTGAALLLVLSSFLVGCSSGSGACTGQGGDAGPPWFWGHAPRYLIEQEMFVQGLVGGSAAFQPEGYLCTVYEPSTQGLSLLIDACPSVCQPRVSVLSPSSVLISVPPDAAFSGLKETQVKVRVEPYPKEAVIDREDQWAVVISSCGRTTRYLSFQSAVYCMVDFSSDPNLMALFSLDSIVAILNGVQLESRKCFPGKFHWEGDECP